MTGSLSWTPSFEHRSEIDLPEGWTYAPLGKLGSWGTGNTPSKANPAFWSGGTLPWVSPKDMKSAYLDDAIDHLTERAVAEGGAAVVPPGTIFFVVRGMILAHTFPVAIVTQRAAFNQDMRSLIPHEGIHAPYLLRALHREGPAILGMVREATHGTLRLESEVLQSWPIPIAPLTEQRRIVEKLEDLLERVNRARGRLERVPLMLKRFRQSVLAAACSGELTREWREAHAEAAVEAPANEVGDDELENSDSFQAELPDTWAWVALDDACEAVIDYRGRTPPTSERGRIPHVRTTNVRRGKIDWNTETFVTDAVYAQYMTRGIPKIGDVIFTMEAPLGDAGVVDTDRKFSLAQRLLLLRGRHGLISGAFLAHMLQASPIRRAIERRATGTTVLGVAYKRLKFVRLPVPPVIEQREIVRRIDELFTLSDAVERRVQVAQSRAEKLPQAVLAKAFSGDLVPQDPNDEPASAALARLRAKEEKMETRKRPPRAKPQKSAQSSPKTQPRDLVELIRSSNKGVAPEDLFVRAGYRADDPEDVARFYQALRDAVNKGLVREHRTSNGDPRIAFVP